MQSTYYTVYKMELRGINLQLHFMCIPKFTNYSAGMISFLLYEPQALHTLCGIISSPHLLHFTRFGADIFQFALRLSLLAFEDLFFGQIDMITPP